MIETMLPLVPNLSATTPAPDPAPLLEQLATLRLENAALHAQNAVLQERIRELEAPADDSVCGGLRWWPCCRGATGGAAEKYGSCCRTCGASSCPWVQWCARNRPRAPPSRPSSRKPGPQSSRRTWSTWMKRAGG